MGADIRAFIAIKLPEELTALLKSTQEVLKKGLRGGKGVNWTRPESIHLTLKFLGEIDPLRVEEISKALDEVAGAHHRFVVSVGGVGGFPNLKAPRVIWVGVDGAEGLKGLQADMEARLGAIGFEQDERGFTPHLTLCRIKTMADSRALGGLASDLKAEKMLDFQAGSFILFESRLNPKGAVYTALKTFALRDGA